MSQFASKAICQKLLEQFKPIDMWKGSDSVEQYIASMYSIDLAEVESAKGYGNEGLKFVNTFLTNKGMGDCLLPGPVGDDDMIAAVYLLILSKWQSEGILIYRNVDNKQVAYAQNPGLVKLDPVTGKHFGVLYLQYGDYVLFEDISTTSMTPLQIESNGVRLASIETSLNQDYSYTGVEFPHVELDIKRDIDEITGVYTEDGKNKLTRVKGQCKLKMNHLGARVEVAMAGIMETTSVRMPKYLTFEKLFNVHFVRQNKVYVSIQATEDAFKEVVIDFSKPIQKSEDTISDYDEYLVNPNLEQRFVA
jgi:hypothetical protein